MSKKNQLMSFWLWAAHLGRRIKIFRFYLMPYKNMINLMLKLELEHSLQERVPKKSFISRRFLKWRIIGVKSQFKHYGWTLMTIQFYFHHVIWEYVYITQVQEWIYQWRSLICSERVYRSWQLSIIAYIS